MAVRQQTSGRWLAYNNRQGWSRGGFVTRAEAEAFDARRRALTTGHVDHASGKLPFGKHLDGWIDHIDGLRSQRTVHDARLIFKSSVPESVKKVRANRVTRRLLQEWVDDMARRGLAGSTVRRYFAPVKTACEWLVREGVLIDNPAKGVQLPKIERDAPNPFTEDEFQALLAAISREEAHLLVRFMGETGARPGEATARKVRDLQRLPFPAIRIQTSKSRKFDERTTKTGQWRVVRLRPDLAEELFKVAEGKGPDDLLFVTPRGRRWTESSFRTWTRWSTVAADHRPYDLRHTAACRWLLAGFAPTTVQHWLGHTSLTMTSHYLRFLGIESDAAALKWVTAAEPSNQRVTAKKKRGRSA